MFGTRSELQQMLGTRTKYEDLEYADPYTKECLDEKSRTGDPLADRLLLQMSEDDLVVGAWRDLIDIVVKEADTRGGVYQEFIDFSNSVPEWVNFEKMVPAQRVIFTRIPNTLYTGMLSFLGGALIPSAFSVAAASEFANQGPPRLIESGTFILKPALGVEPGSLAHYELMRVRVIHAAIRFFMNQKRGEHVGDELLGDDEYVNQSQMTYFMTGFSFLHLRTATRMGIALSDEQLESHHHLWRYMGYVMGIDEDVLTEDLFEEQKLAHAVMKHEVRPELTDHEFVTMIETLLNEAFPKWKTARSRERELMEMKAVILYALGEDFVGGWGLSFSDPDLRAGLRRAKLKVQTADAIQRLKPVELVQFELVKQQFVRGRKKLLLSIDTTGGEDTLGEISESDEKHPMVKVFETVIAKLETASAN